MEHIKRMKVELKELKEKINNGLKFLSSEKRESKFMNEDQISMLEKQLEMMIHYNNILIERIEYEENLIK